MLIVDASGGTSGILPVHLSMAFSPSRVTTHRSVSNTTTLPAVISPLYPIGTPSSVTLNPPTTLLVAVTVMIAGVSARPALSIVWLAALVNAGIVTVGLDTEYQWGSFDLNVRPRVAATSRSPADIVAPPE